MNRELAISTSRLDRGRRQWLLDHLGGGMDPHRSRRRRADVIALVAYDIDACLTRHGLGRLAAGPFRSLYMVESRCLSPRPTARKPCPAPTTQEGSRPRRSAPAALGPASRYRESGGSCNRRLIHQQAVYLILEDFMPTDVYQRPLRQADAVDRAGHDEGLRQHMLRVYNIMGLGLQLTIAMSDQVAPLFHGQD